VSFLKGLVTRKAAPPLARDDALRLRPVRNPAVTWTEPAKVDDDDEEASADDRGPEPDALRLVLPQKRDRLGTFLERFFGPSGKRQIGLDSFGAKVWLLCDGVHTIGDLVDMTSTTYKLNRRQAEVSVLAFMKMLSQRQLIGYVKDERKQPDVNPGNRRRRAHRPRKTGRRQR